VGLITNHTGLTADGRSTIDALHDQPDIQLVALFGPEHGLRGTADAGEHVASNRDDRTGLPIHSLYGETQKPTPDMLREVDVLVFDIQDVGTRYYTYLWTMALAMQAAAEQDKGFVVLDRPDPIGGQLVQGNVLDTAFASFVGLYPVPMRLGMTAGELARLLNDEFDVGADLTVVPVEGWSRDAYYDDTGLPWVPPSPNMPTVESATHYPGSCLFEGTNLSVGRGTPRAFQQIGAPWLDAATIATRLEARGIEGVRIEAVTFTPKQPGDGKYGGEQIPGLRYTVTDRATYDPARTAVATLVELQSLHGDSLQFLESHFDRLAGTDQLRLGVLAGQDAGALTADWDAQIARFDELRRRHLIY
ncbi:MAG: exo-beta-N-acetylmuramidase NamZ family protein, partial [Longimicrobiales bacterium]